MTPSVENTEELSPQEKNLLKRIFAQRVIRDKEGNPINHRVWFKNIFNPILRKLGWVIVSNVQDDGTISGYSVRKYKK